MSIHGGVRRQMNLLAFKWERFIDNDSTKLIDGWNLTITIGPIDLGIAKVRNRKCFMIRKDALILFGYGIEFSRNWENPHKHVFGDASERLLKK